MQYTRITTKLDNFCILSRGLMKIVDKETIYWTNPCSPFSYIYTILKLQEKIVASSRGWPARLPAFLGDGAWSPRSSSYDHHITVDLGHRHEIRSIATQGRSHTNEFVTEYTVQYSDDGQAWSSYVGRDGVDEVL